MQCTVLRYSEEYKELWQCSAIAWRAQLKLRQCLRILILLYSVQYKMHNAQCTVGSVHCAQCILKLAVRSIRFQCSVFIVHCVVCSIVFGHGWLCHPTSPRGRFSENFNVSSGFIIQGVKVQTLIHFYDSLYQ